MYVRMNCENNILITHSSGRQAGVFTFEPLLQKINKSNAQISCMHSQSAHLFSLHTIFLYSLIPKFITKTCQCNAYPLEPHFYIAKTGVCRGILIFLLLKVSILSKNKKSIKVFQRKKNQSVKLKTISVYCMSKFL